MGEKDPAEMEDLAERDDHDEHFDLALTREYFAGLATFQNVTQAAALEHSQFLLHMCLALLLIMLMMVVSLSRREDHSVFAWCCC